MVSSVGSSFFGVGSCCSSFSLVVVGFSFGVVVFLSVGLVVGVFGVEELWLLGQGCLLLIFRLCL